MKRFLITTPLEETWRQNEPVLLLGEWCLTYPRQPVNLGLDAKVMPYHWNDRTKLFADYQYVCSYYEVVLKKLSVKLNEFHKVNHSIRYWRVLIGPWLGMFMLMLFDRWNSIRQALENYDLSGSVVLIGGEKDFIPNDMNEFNLFFPSDEWNHYIYAKIMEYFPGLQLFSNQRTKSFGARNVSTDFGSKYKLKQFFRVFFSQVSALFSREEDAFFLSTYLTKREEAELCIRLKQLPRFFYTPAVLRVAVDFSKRNWLLDKTNNTFETCLNTLLSRQIPRIYLEGYQQLVCQAKTLPWPKRPKVIWTSNSFYADDLFKVWAADKVEKGSPLIIGQHGGNYGMGLWNWGEEHEMAISNCYLTWGWLQPSNPRLRSIGKIRHSSPVKHVSEHGSAILVTMITQRYGNPTLAMHTSTQWLAYLRDQFEFVDALPVHIQNKLIVRLSRADYGWRQADRWRDRFPDLQINDGFSDINKLIKNSRLYISTYNATTYLESLSMNVPTVIYWDPKYVEINVWVQPYFDDLTSVGIFHKNPQSAAHHVTKIWEDITSWWTNPETRAVRERFVNQFAYSPVDKMSRLKNVINEATSQC